MSNVLVRRLKNIKPKPPKGAQNTNNESHVTLVDKIAEKLGIQTQEDWYSVTYNVFVQNGGSAFIQKHYRASLHRALSNVYPQFIWYPWKFTNSPKGFWPLPEHRRSFFLWLEEELEIKHPTDWYRVRTSDIVERGGGGVLQFYYNESLHKALKEVYPNYPWDPSKFHCHWSSKTQQREFLEKVAKDFGIVLQEDWYKIGHTQFVNYAPRAATLLRYSGNSMLKLLSSVYPEFEWFGWKFLHAPQRYWSSMKNQREFFDQLGTQLGITKFEDWYQVRFQHLKELRVLSIIQHYYKGSIVRALQTVYPEYPWLPWAFATCPRHFWTKSENVQKYLEWLSTQVNLESKDDWYNMTRVVIRTYGGASMLKNTTWLETLSKVYPNVNWDEKKLTARSRNRKAQVLLHKHLKVLFPNVADIYTDYKHPQLNLKNTNERAELDIFIPNLSLAFEYHGVQHYKLVPMFGPSRRYQSTDSWKRDECKKLGITLIEIPYWWTFDRDSLAATIHKYRPDVIEDPGPGQPIPEVNPNPIKITSQFNKFLGLDGDPWNGSTDLDDWWTTPMYHGLKFVFDGERIHLPGGKVFFPPPFAHTSFGKSKQPLIGKLVFYCNDQT